MQILSNWYWPGDSVMGAVQGQFRGSSGAVQGQFRAQTHQMRFVFKPAYKFIQNGWKMTESGSHRIAL